MVLGMPAIRNSKMADEGAEYFTVLNLIGLTLPKPWWWHWEDMENPNAKGAIFRTWGEGEPRGLNIAHLIVVDVTNDPTEPDISHLTSNDVATVDQTMRQDIERGLTTDGQQLVRWMSSQLNQISQRKGLVTTYITMEQGRERQCIALRLSVAGRKVVVMGSFDVSQHETLAEPISSALWGITVLKSTE